MSELPALGVLPHSNLASTPSVGQAAPAPPAQPVVHTPPLQEPTPGLALPDDGTLSRAQRELREQHGPAFDRLQELSAASLTCVGDGLQVLQTLATGAPAPTSGGADPLSAVGPTEGLGDFLLRAGGDAEQVRRRVLGSANAPKEGDRAIGVGAAATPAGEEVRRNARALLLRTSIAYLTENPPHRDQVYTEGMRALDAVAYAKVRDWPLGQLRAFVLDRPEAEIKAIMGGLSSDVIGCLVKTLDNEELVALGAKIFNPMPGSLVGAPGYLAARIQPNSPTENPEDILWQSLNGLSFGLHLLLLGTNPVDGTVRSVAKVEETLRDIVQTFGLEDLVPWCVLGQHDRQAEIAKTQPELVPLLFQSLAGTDATNTTFDVTVDALKGYVASGLPGFYWETGQGSEFTNRGDQGVDMVLLESRKYGLVRALKADMARVHPERPWMHVNDVSGFIGPEVFRDREQLVRVCLEDLVMGKLHGLCMGLDICATLHMDVSLDDLQWCQDQIVRARPAYLMALPTRNDPMLSYLTTSFQDHVRLREQQAFAMDPRFTAFYQRIGVMDAQGRLTEHAGDPLWVWLQYRRAKGDDRPDPVILAEGRERLQGVTERGVDLAVGHGANVWDLAPELDARVRTLYADAKLCLKSELSPDFVKSMPGAIELQTYTDDKDAFISQPKLGEVLAPESVERLQALRASWGNDIPDVQIVVSDGLNANAIMDPGHLAPYLQEVERLFAARGMKVSDTPLVVRNGRVRAGYEIGRALFADTDPQRPRVLLHVIGERPGTLHRNYSVYVAAPKAEVWTAGTCDHNLARVVSGISDTALAPAQGARDTLSLMDEILATKAPTGPAAVA